MQQIEFSETLLVFLQRMQSLDEFESQKRLRYPHPARLLRHFRKSHTDRHVTDGEEEHDNDRMSHPDLSLYIQLHSIQ